MPPCPGKKAPVSFTLEIRFSEVPRLSGYRRYQREGYQHSRAQELPKDKVPENYSCNHSDDQSRHTTLHRLVRRKSGSDLVLTKRSTSKICSGVVKGYNRSDPPHQLHTKRGGTKNDKLRGADTEQKERRSIALSEAAGVLKSISSSNYLHHHQRYTTRLYGK